MGNNKKFEKEVNSSNNKDLFLHKIEFLQGAGAEYSYKKLNIVYKLMYSTLSGKSIDVPFKIYDMQHVTVDAILSPQIKTELKNVSIRNGIKISGGVLTEIIKREKLDNEIKTAYYTSIMPTMTTSYILGVDYKKIKTDLEIGVKHLFNKGYSAEPKLSIKVGGVIIKKNRIN